MLYELRTYVTSPEAVDGLHERFATVNLGVFERVGIDVVAFFTEDADPLRITYLVRFSDENARSAAWAAFASDPEWLAAKLTSEERFGKLVLSSTSTLLHPTPYSPMT
jgi:hypothetical protein